MGCKSCGSRGGRFGKDIPMLDSKGNRLSDNYAKLRMTSKARPTSIRIKRPDANTSTNKYNNLIEIRSGDSRINILEYDSTSLCVYIIGYMEGCGACNYMKRLINKIVTPEMKMSCSFYILDKQITDPVGFEFSGNPTILFVDNGKLIFQVGGVYNKIGDRIATFLAP